MGETAFNQLTSSAERTHWLKQKANWIRLSAMTMTNHAGLGHTGVTFRLIHTHFRG